MSEFSQLGVVLTSQGLKYAVTGARTNSSGEVDTVPTELKSDEAHAKVSHNTWVGAFLVW